MIDNKEFEFVKKLVALNVPQKIIDRSISLMASYQAALEDVNRMYAEKMEYFLEQVRTDNWE